MTNKLNTWFVGAENRKSPISIYYPKQREKAEIVLFAHGFKGYKDWGHFPLIQQYLAEKGFIAVAFNFSHNGGTVDEEIDFPDLDAFAKNTYQKEVEDVGHVLDWIKVNRELYFASAEAQRIHIIGHSRGGGVALLAGSKYHEIKKVVTWAAVADFMERLPNAEQLEEWKKNGVYYVKNGRTHQDMPMNYHFVETLMNFKDELNIQRSVQNLEKPLLVVHGANDETVALENADRIKSWKKEVQLAVIKECNHTFNGHHPWNDTELPKVTIEALALSLAFLKA
ncbi:MAG: dienelactone hydrolase [Vicingaceae bacterium]|jgi:dienelactone hydrolase